jgi:hypothetical protein
VVSRAFGRRGGKRRAPWLLSAAAVVVAMIALPMDGWPGSSSAGGRAGPSLPAFPWAQDEDYDPAAAYFYSLLSFGAMQMIAPAVFGDFQSPVAVSYTPQLSVIMLQDAGFDTAVSTMLNGVVQQDLLPTGGALIAEEFGIGASPDSAPDADAAPPSANGSDFSAGVPTASGDVSDPAVDAGGIEPTCVEDRLPTSFRPAANTGTPRERVSEGRDRRRRNFLWGCSCGRSRSQIPWAISDRPAIGAIWSP